MAEAGGPPTFVEPDATVDKWSRPKAICASGWFRSFPHVKYWLSIGVGLRS